MELLASSISTNHLKYSFRLLDTVISHGKINEASDETPEIEDDLFTEYGEWLQTLVKESVRDNSSFEWLLRFLYLDLTSRIGKAESMERFFDQENTKIIIDILYDYVKGNFAILTKGEIKMSMICTSNRMVWSAIND